MVTRPMIVHSFIPVRDGDGNVDDDLMEMMLTETPAEKPYSNSAVLRVDRCVEDAWEPGTVVMVTIDRLEDGESPESYSAG